MENKTIIPAFVAKAYTILQDPQCQSAISWITNGKQFLIKNVHELQSKVLPKYFRHHNLNSFIRQLNMYGFHKSRKDCAQIVFAHPFFIQASPELLKNIKRKVKTDLPNGQNIKPTDFEAETPDSKPKTNQSTRNENILQEVQNNVILKQQPIDQIKDVPLTFKSSTSIMLKPLWSLENTLEEFSTKQQRQFRCLMEKSEIFDFKPDLGIDLEIIDTHENANLLNLNDQELDDTSVDGDFGERRREIENEADRVPSIRTFHFINEVYF